MGMLHMSESERNDQLETFRSPQSLIETKETAYEIQLAKSELRLCRLASLVWLGVLMAGSSVIDTASSGALRVLIGVMGVVAMLVLLLLMRLSHDLGVQLRTLERIRQGKSPIGGEDYDIDLDR